MRTIPKWSQTQKHINTTVIVFKNKWIPSIEKTQDIWKGKKENRDSLGYGLQNKKRMKTNHNYTETLDYDYNALNTKTYKHCMEK